MPFASPFGSVTTPSFNPGYSNVPQNKAAKAPTASSAVPPKAKEEGAVSTEDSPSLLTAGIKPALFVPREAAVPPTPPQPTPMAMPSVAPAPTPLSMPTPFPTKPMFIPSQHPGMPSFFVIPVFTPESEAPPTEELPALSEPQMPRRINPNRPIFV